MSNNVLHIESSNETNRFFNHNEESHVATGLTINSKHNSQAEITIEKDGGLIDIKIREGG